MIQFAQFDELLIFTDGTMSDYKPTLEKISDASYWAPLSILIAGVGNMNFGLLKYSDLGQ